MARPRKIKPEETKEEEVVATPKPATPKKAKKPRVIGGGSLIDLLSDESIHQQTKDFLALAGHADGFKTADEVTRDYLPLPGLLFQYLVGRAGLPANTIVEILGRPNTGKSSLVMSFLCHFTKYSVPCLFVNCEAKMLEPDWIERLTNTDKETGARIIKAIDVQEKCYTYSGLESFINNWIEIKRVKLGIPREVPLVIAVDAYTKLKNSAEAEVTLKFEEPPKTAKKTTAKKKKDTKKGIDDISAKPGVSASWIHNWVRQLKETLEEHNVTLILISGTNAKLSMSPAGFAPDGGDSLNKERRGGEAVNQSSCFQMTLTNAGGLKNETTKQQYGISVRARVVKNAYGPYRDVKYILRNDKFIDNDKTTHQAIQTAEGMCEIMVINKVFGMTVTSKRYSSDVLGVYSVKADTMLQHIMADDGLVAAAAEALGIYGYE